MSLDVIDGRDSGALGNSEVIDEDGIAHVHLVEGVAPCFCVGHAIFGGVNGQHI